MDRREGDEIAGRYVIEREIGRGGMGAVYAALDKRLGRRVALKTLSDDQSHTRARLEAEARAVASLEHPSIVTLFDVLEDSGETILVMELVVGESLRKIADVRDLSTEEVATVVYEVADALAAAHAKGLVHRDVKPDNIMMRDDGRIALLDFGVAKQMTSSDPNAFFGSTTGAGVIVGTPAYLSPEQAHAKPIGPSSDQFALAVTAYELLAKSLPWPTTTPMLAIAAIVSADPKPLEGFDASVFAVLLRALSKKPADRFSNVRDFANAFGAALGVPQPSRPRALLPTATSVKRLPLPIEIDKTLRATERRFAPPPRRSRARAITIAFTAIAIALACGWFVARKMKRTRAASTSDASLTLAATAPLAIADLPADGTNDETARAKFREAMRDLASGRGNVPVIALLDEALAIDPQFASAALQRAVVSFRIAGALDESGRRAYRAALDAESKLGVRDRALLHALGPSFADPPDWIESGKRL